MSSKRNLFNTSEAEEVVPARACYVEYVHSQRFGENRKLDQVQALQVYLHRTVSVRAESVSLFLTFASRTKMVPSPWTVARWLMLVISVMATGMSWYILVMLS